MVDSRTPSTTISRLPVQKVSVILPAYNKGEVISSCVERLISVLESVTYDWEIVLVDDGSQDDTWREINKLTSLYPKMKAIKLLSNIGKGYALKRGFLESSGDVIIFFDADLDISPEVIPSYLDIIQWEADVVIGSKRHDNSRVLYNSTLRKLLSEVYSLLIRLLLRLPFRDTQTGLKVFRREVLKDILPLTCDRGFAFDAELLALAKKAGFKILEAPVVVRYSLNSTITVRSIISIFFNTMKLAVSLVYRKPTRSLCLERSIQLLTRKRGAFV